MLYEDICTLQDKLRKMADDLEILKAQCRRKKRQDPVESKDLDSLLAGLADLSKNPG